MLKDYKQDILLVTGVLGSYANVVEKLHRDLNKHKATLLKIERAGDVLAEAVSEHLFNCIIIHQFIFSRNYSKEWVDITNWTKKYTVKYM